jgi:hypothetical protein
VARELITEKMVWLVLGSLLLMEGVCKMVLFYQKYTFLHIKTGIPFTGGVLKISRKSIKSINNILSGPEKVKKPGRALHFISREVCLMATSKVDDIPQSIVLVITGTYPLCFSLLQKGIL